MNDKNGNDRKHKHSVFKNVMIILACAVFAGIYILGGCYLVSKFMTGGEENADPAWLENVEVHVDEENQPEEPEQPETVEVIIRDEDNSETQENPESVETVTESVTEIQKETDTKENSTEENTTKEKASEKQSVEVSHVQAVQQDDTPLAVVTDVSAVVKAAMPCVVSITNQYTSYDYWYDEMVDDEINGSGIIVAQNDEELLIVTNYHVIEDSNTLSVQFIDDTEATAYVKGTSPDDDLAIVSVFLSDVGDDTIDSVAIAALGDSDELQVGEPAIAIGNSLGYGQSVTTGVISALNRDIYSETSDVSQGYLIQTDAAINPGNSGGALLNVKGEVIGINSSKIADYVIEGMGYAIPISTAKPIIDNLVLKETKKKVSDEEKAFLGISGTDVSDDAMEKYDMPAGIFVSSVLENTGAYKAGIIKGDIITEFDGENLTQMTSLQNMLEYYKAGTKVKVVIMRQSNGEYKEKTITVTLGHKNE
jgi:serine protease Do